MRQEKGWAGLGVLLLAAAGTVAAVQYRQGRRRHPPVGRFVTVRGVRLHYVEQGTGAPLILLHGNGSMAQDFLTSDLVRLAARRFRVIVFDRPGYGWSERPRGRVWTAADQAGLLSDAAAMLGAGEAIVFGHSWGTLVAAEWALRRPDTTRALVLASGYFYPTPRVDALMTAVNAVPGLGDVLRRTATPLLAWLSWPLVLRKLFGPSVVPRHFEGFPKGLALEPQALRASAEEAALMVPSVEGLAERLAASPVPIAILAGDGDRMVSTPDQSARLHADIAQSRLRVFPGVGHMVHHIEPRGVFDAILDIAGADQPLLAAGDEGTRRKAG